MHWRRKWQPTPVFLPGESQGRGSLVGCRLWVAQSRTRLKRLSSSSKVIAAYPDGKPAAIETPYGKGKVIVFACQPFGSAALSLEPGKWMDFFREQAQKVGEKVNLPIWDFTLPKAPEEIKLEKNW